VGKSRARQGDDGRNWANLEADTGAAGHTLVARVAGNHHIFPAAAQLPAAAGQWALPRQPGQPSWPAHNLLISGCQFGVIRRKSLQINVAGCGRVGVLRFPAADPGSPPFAHRTHATSKLRFPRMPTENEVLYKYCIRLKHNLTSVPMYNIVE
jgi:predicted small lipoprotein YifL